MKVKKEYASKNMHTPSLVVSQKAVDELVKTEGGEECRIGVVGCLLQTDISYEKLLYLVNLVNATISQMFQCKTNSDVM